MYVFDIEQLDVLTFSGRIAVLFYFKKFEKVQRSENSNLSSDWLLGHWEKIVQVRIGMF